MPAKGKLYLLPTVLSDGAYATIPSGVREAIPQLTYFLVENIRTARRYISGLDLGVDISTLRFEVVDKNTDQATIERLMQPLLDGISIGVLSESGCPGIADPGARIAARAHQWEIEVIPFTGPSSILLSLMASGFNGQQFSFHGYLPIDKKARERTLRDLEAASRKEDRTQIFIETPYRNDQMLASVLAVCAPSTRLCVARDITGPGEWIRSAPVGQWKKWKPELHKVPAVFLIYAGSGF